MLFSFWYKGSANLKCIETVAQILLSIKPCKNIVTTDVSHFAPYLPVEKII